MRVLTWLSVLLGFSLLSCTVDGALITNGNFESGDFSGWTLYLTTNGTLTAPAVVSFDTNGDTVTTDSARFNAGRVSPSGPAPAGGGIFQTITTIAGELQLSADIAGSLNGQNGSAGIFELMLDGVVVESHDFGFVNRETKRETLSFTSNVTAGTHEVRIQVTRPFNASAATPAQFIDNVTAVQQSAAIPEPSAWIVLAGLALCYGIATYRRGQWQALS